jgi:hypothetical protein
VFFSFLFPPFFPLSENPKLTVVAVFLDTGHPVLAQCLPLSPWRPSEAAPRCKCGKAQGHEAVAGFLQRCPPCPFFLLQRPSFNFGGSLYQPCSRCFRRQLGRQHGSEDSGVQWKKSKVEEKGKGKRKEVSEIEESGEEKLKEPVDFKDAD